MKADFTEFDCKPDSWQPHTGLVTLLYLLFTLCTFHVSRVNPNKLNFWLGGCPHLMQLNMLSYLAKFENYWFKGSEPTFYFILAYYFVFRALNSNFLANVNFKRFSYFAKFHPLSNFIIINKTKFPQFVPILCLLSNIKA